MYYVHVCVLSHVCVDLLFDIEKELFYWLTVTAPSLKYWTLICYAQVMYIIIKQELICNHALISSTNANVT